jgi:hypothetical protein
MTIFASRGANTTNRAATVRERFPCPRSRGSVEAPLAGARTGRTTAGVNRWGSYNHPSRGRQPAVLHTAEEDEHEVDLRF